MTIKIPLQVLSIEGDGFHLQVKVKVNGKAALMIVDTGASRTVFDKAQIAAYLQLEQIAEHDRVSTGLGTASMQSHVVTLGRFTLGKLQLNQFPAVVLDLQHVNQTYDALGFSPIVGVLGSDVLVAHKAVIDFHKRSMALQPLKIAVKKSAAKKKAAKKKAVKKVAKKRARR
jgi:hypothetical protein